MRYRIPGRLGAFPPGWGGKSFYESIRDTSRQQTGDQQTGDKSVYESMLNVSQRQAGGGLYQSGGLKPPPEEQKDEETSPLVWVAGLGAVGVLAYLLMRSRL